MRIPPPRQTREGLAQFLTGEGNLIGVATGRRHGVAPPVAGAQLSSQIIKGRGGHPERADMLREIAVVKQCEQ
jgi:hypothetical protein